MQESDLLAHTESKRNKSDKSVGFDSATFHRTLAFFVHRERKTHTYTHIHIHIHIDIDIHKASFFYIPR